MTSRGQCPRGGGACECLDPPPLQEILYPRLRWERNVPELAVKRGSGWNGDVMRDAHTCRRGWDYTSQGGGIPAASILNHPKTAGESRREHHSI